MATDTRRDLRNQVMYSVFVRNYSPEGTFEGLRRDLKRIRALGVDVIWLMPIHPVGEACRKGSLGSPYAVRDYRAVNPEFGALEDFVSLCEDIHDLGMKVIIDVVYNHTAPDSVLARTHPEWFYHRPDGSFGNRVGDWTDIIDLDYGQSGLWDYQIETLKYWARWVDGFRCDVAPLVPLEFWLRARREVAAVRPGCLWLAETVERDFVRFLRGRGMTALSDAEAFQAFDVCYEYDVYPEYMRWLRGEIALADYAGALALQDVIYPDNYVKLRFLENHDRPRAAHLFPDPRTRRNHTAFSFFSRGMALLYNGQETGCAHRPDLFDPDPIDWRSGEDISPFIARLAALKRHPLMAEGSYTLSAYGQALLAGYRRDSRRLIGLFSLDGGPTRVQVDLPDGAFENLLDGRPVRVECGLLTTDGEPVVIETR